jgi:ABC-2 type transport system permease protein
MRSKTLTVALYEFTSTLKRRSALFVMLGLPLISVALLAGLNWLAARESGDTGPSALSQFAFGNQDEERPPTAVIDHTGRLQNYPPPVAHLIPLASEEEAQAAYEAGEIEGYFVVPADYLETGEVTLYAENRQFDSPIEFELNYLLTANYIEDAALVDAVTNPADIQEVDLGAAEGQQTSFGQGYVLGIAVAILFYMTAISASGYLLQSLGKEKENRVMEILLSSVRPIELLLGKMIGLGAIGLLQLLIWTVITTTIFRGNETSPFSNIPLPTLKPAVWLIIIAHFIAGYLVYAGLFAGLGAIAPNPKESGQITFFLMIPVILPMWLNTILLSAPNGTMATVMSLFPLTSPVAMPMRLAATTVPTWHWLFSLAAALLTAVLTLLLAARIFRSQVLLSGQSLSLRTAWQLVRGS